MSTNQSRRYDHSFLEKKIDQAVLDNQSHVEILEADIHSSSTNAKAEFGVIAARLNHLEERIASVESKQVD